MTVVKNPLFSFDAKGKFGGSIVYTSSPVAQVARVKKNPSNPNTPAQQIYRARIAQVVDRWRDDKLTTLDHDCWDRFATITRRKISGYNEFTREGMSILKKSITAFDPGYHIRVNAPTAWTWLASVTRFDAAFTAFIHYGTKPYSLRTIKPCLFQLNYFYYSAVFSSPYKDLYFRFYLYGLTNLVGKTGVLHFRPGDFLE